MLKRRDAFLKKSALAVSVALLLSSQALAHKTLSEPLTGTIWLDNGTQSLESASVIDRNGNANGDTNVTGKNFAVGSGAIIWDAGKSMAVGHKTAVFNADNSVALGYGSQVNGESNVLSVGAGPSGYGFSVDGAPETRRIINVSDGVKDSDAATKGQMDNAIADAVRVSGDALRGEIGGVYRDARAHTDSQVTAVRDELKAEGDSLRGEIGGVYRDARAHTDSQVTAVRDELKAEGDSLRGEIGGVYRDARAHTDSQVTAVRDELSRDIIAGTSAAVAYTDASSLALQDEIKEKADETVQVSRAYTDKSVRDARKEAKSQAEHLSDVLVKNRAQTDAAIASNTAAIRNNSHRLDLTEAWQKMATERMNNMQEQIKENRKELRESAAQSAALAGLFQPYSVGKFNATAAVGGYRDEQAIAVGVGYRFTENVAGKVAVAAGGSSASWNAGVNFEF
ncbi:YadA-like family protein [Escherichia coli]|uniref:Immunoglobulin-binding protein n=11 Tax=Escherichia coli TaxID=562 RepID=A0A0P0SVI1_ECOLX|nr:YadA-like family protein [Escherichia coli]EEZ9845526.1 immunoglobulin-binding protein [Escherichia coli O119]EFA5375404.1 immunoglobulin-binding protein [Escherichia coli O53]EFA5394445.1 immunoglobulin-binding protein [Escherichia coli O6]EFT1027824.1 immunoglobulin-binding protein [Shigella sonnei]MCC1575870.1 YadA-like family protein [Salmonella enterica subsp. enterica serovar Indiana]